MCFSCNVTRRPHCLLFGLIMRSRTSNDFVSRLAALLLCPFDTSSGTTDRPPWRPVDRNLGRVYCYRIPYKNLSRVSISTIISDSFRLFQLAPEMDVDCMWDEKILKIDPCSIPIFKHFSTCNAEVLSGTRFRKKIEALATRAVYRKWIEHLQLYISMLKCFRILQIVQESHPH